MYIKIYNVSKKVKVDAKSRSCSAYIGSLINIQKKFILLKNLFVGTSSSSTIFLVIKNLNGYKYGSKEYFYGNIFDVSFRELTKSKHEILEIAL
jgi:hypothetical protein